MPERDRWVHGKNASKSIGLYRDLAASTQGQIPYYPSVPADWPWSKEFKKKYGKNLAFNKSEAMHSDSLEEIKRRPPKGDIAGFKKWIAQSSAKRDSRLDRLSKKVKIGDEFQIGPDSYIVVLGEPSGGGKVRLTRFDKDGFSGHTTFQSMEELSKELVSEYAPQSSGGSRMLKPVHGILDSLFPTKRFQDGMIRSQEIQRLNTLGWKKMQKESTTDILISRIQYLLERAARIKPIIMYHGTSSKNLRSILKQGLIPDPKSRVWQDDPDAAQSYITVTRKSLSGSYLSDNIGTATSAALTAAQKSKGEQLVVVASLQPRSGFADEDDIVYEARNAMKKAMFPQGVLGAEDQWPAVWIGYIADPDDAKKAISEFGKEFKKNLEGDLPGVGKIPLAPKALEDMFWGLLEQVTAKWYAHNKKMPYRAEDYYYSAVKRLNLTRDQEHKYYALMLKRLQQLSLQKAEKRYLDAADKLTRQLKGIAVPKEGAFRTNVRVGDTINYKGQNKILAIFEIRYGKDEEGNTETHVKVHYGKIPSKAMADLKQKQGAIKIVDSFKEKSWWAESMVFSDPQTPQEKRALKKNKSQAESLIDVYTNMLEDNGAPGPNNSSSSVLGNCSSCFDHSDDIYTDDSMRESAESLIERVVNGEDPAELIELFSQIRRVGSAIRRGAGAVSNRARRGVRKVQRGFQRARSGVRRVQKGYRRFQVKRALKAGARVKARKAKFMAKAAKKMRKQAFQARLKKLRSGESKNQYTSADVINLVLEGSTPAELIEKISYAYDIRLDQNIKTSPIYKAATGEFCTASADNRKTGF